MSRGASLRHTAQQLQKEARKKSLHTASRQSTGKHKAKSTKEFLTVGQDSVRTGRAIHYVIDQPCL